MRALDQLIDRNDPGLAVLREWIASDDANPTLILPPEQALAEQTLLRLQVTTRSLLGAVAYETGGVLVDDGLIRLFGSGSRRSLLGANRAVGLLAEGGSSDVILVGDDVLGGLFALNGGGFGGRGLGEVFHLPPDETAWTPLEVGHSEFVSWCVTGDVASFYSSVPAAGALARRPRPEIDKAYSFYPLLWTQEARNGDATPREVAADESLRLRIELCGFAVG